MACARCEEREHEVIWLRAQLAMDDDADSLARLRERLGLWPSLARALLALFNRRGRITSAGLLVELMGSMAEDEPRQAVMTIFRLRERLGVYAIETVRGAGYRLSPTGAARVAACLKSRPRRKA